VLLVTGYNRWREFAIRAICNSTEHGLQIRASGVY